MRTFAVYCHKHKLTGKRYIGISSDVKRRWRCNGVEYKSDSGIFGAVIAAEGWDSFEHEILETGLTEDEACNREKYYIAKYDTRNREHGYNIAEGGMDSGLGKLYEDHPRGMLGKHHNEHKKTQQRELMKKLVAEGKCGAVWKNGHPRGMLGKHQSEEYKQRLREIPPDKHPSAKEVIVEHKDGIIERFGCLRYLAEKYGISESTLIKTIKSNKPYTISANTHSNLENLKKIDGARIYYYQTIPR